MSTTASGPVIPKSFVSYSWDGSEHQTWVKALAAKLRSDGVDVTLDQWALAPGDQLPKFMETAIRENDFVLIICTLKYKQKSDSRQGGVGYEGDIMTGEVLTGQDSRKFIPILREGEWKDIAPSWLASKFYLNFRGEPYSEDIYEMLLNHIHGTREQAPPLGTRPAARSGDQFTGTGIFTLVAPPETGPIRITSIVLTEIGTPRWDDTAGSALYTVPFQFSRCPSPEWARHFIQTWNIPPSFSTMHRPQIAHIEGDRLILEGTTVDEIEKYHRDTLKAVLDKVNKDIAELEAKQRSEEARRAELLRQHKQSVEEAA